MKKNMLIGFLSIAGLLFLTSPAYSQKEKEAEKTVNVSGYIQTHLYSDLNPPEDLPDRTYDFYIKRVRLFVSGKLNDKVKFLVGTLNAGYGKDGNFSARTWIADAWLEYTYSKKFKINIGQVKLPFTRHMQQSGASLHGLDFHGSFIKYPQNSTHRDQGVVFRGLLQNDKLDYRFAIVDGLDPAATVVPRDNDYPRIVGRLGFNVFDAEPDYFWAGTYLGKKKILSFAVSLDYQSAMKGIKMDEAYHAFGLDALLDHPIGTAWITSTLNYHSFGEGGAIPKGSGFWADLGVRFDKIEPIIAIENYNPSVGDTGKRNVFLAGLNYWIDGHNTNLKFQYGTEKLNGADESHNKLLIQVQVKF